MLKSLQNRTFWVRVVLGVIVAILGAGMLLYLVPQGTSSITSSDTVADIGGQPITVVEVRRQLDRMTRGQQIPAALMPLYAQQIVQQLEFERMLEIEAKRQGIRVTQEEQIERIRQLVPTSFLGDSVVGMDQYAAEVSARFGMAVPEFEDLVRQGILEEKIRRLVTDGVMVTREEIVQEFQHRNEKVKIQYVLISPDALESKINPTDAEISSYFDKNKSRYIVPERRVVRYALLDATLLRQKTQVPEADLRAYYTQHIIEFQVQNRVHVEHILFKTVGKTDAEIAEIRKKAEDVLKQARKGANFEDLAKKYSEDDSKEKGGDIGWIVRKQTVPEFEAVAFSQPKGAISDLVKTQYGFHIIKVLDREDARTKAFEEVRGQIQPILAAQLADQAASDLAARISDAIRKGGRIPVDQLAQQFNLTVTETAPVAATDTLPELGASPEIRDAIFRLRPGDVNLPIHTDRGYVVLSVKEIQPQHLGTLAEVHDKVLADYRHEKSVELAKARSEELDKHAQAGEDLAAAAKALGLEAKTSDPFARNGNIPGVGGARQLSVVFSLQPGQVSPPINLVPNWVVSKVVDHTEPNPADFEKQKTEIEQQLLQSKRELAYEAFRNALEQRLKAEGLLKINADAMKQLTNPA